MVQPITNLPIGSKIKFGKYQVNIEEKEDIIWQIAAKNHEGYPENSITLITEKIIDLRGFDAKEPSNADSDRRTYGNNRYKDSNLRQWLNKSGKDWFEKAHNADEPPTDGGMSQPTGYNTKEGFLSSFTQEELGAILDTTLTVAKNTVTDGGGTEVVTDKVFLLSNTEVGLANESGGAEGSLLPLFSGDASRIAYLTQQAFDNTLSGNKPSTVSSAWAWWLRSPFSYYSRNVRLVGATGALDYSIASIGYYGVRPTLNISSEILVSDIVDSDGAYIIIHNNPPIISGEDIDLGTQVQSFSYEYEVMDSNGDIVSVVEKLNGDIVNIYDNPESTSFTLNIDLKSVPRFKTNTIEIIATDDKGEISTRTITFIRGISEESSLSDITEGVSDLIPHLKEKKGLIEGAITNVDSGIIIPTDPTFNDLASAIGQISTGKKWASGSANIDSNANLTITDLNFKPSLVILALAGGYFSYFAIMDDSGFLINNENIAYCYYNGSTYSLRNEPRVTHNSFITDNGFSIKRIGNIGGSAHVWIAYE